MHDELVVEVADEIATDVAANLADLMAGVAELAVPLEVDSGIGANWAEAHR